MIGGMMSAFRRSYCQRILQKIDEFSDRDDGWLEVDLGITGWGSRPYPQFYLDVMLVTDAAW